MLKITSHVDSRTAALQLEGRLAGPWVAELERCWREVARAPQPRATTVDLSGVTFIDSKGKTLLTRMWEAGATLVASGCLTTCIVEEIMETGRDWTKTAKKDAPGEARSGRRERD